MNEEFRYSDSDLKKLIRGLAKSNFLTNESVRIFDEGDKLGCYVRIRPSKKKKAPVSGLLINHNEALKHVLSAALNSERGDVIGDYTDDPRVLIAFFREYGVELPEFKDIEESIGLDETKSMTKRNLKMVHNKLIELYNMYDYDSPEYITEMTNNVKAFQEELFTLMGLLGATLDLEDHVLPLGEIEIERFSQSGNFNFGYNFFVPIGRIINPYFDNRFDFTARHKK